MTERHEPGEEYAGAAALDGAPVHVHLRGHIEPIDGRFHWFGRIHAADAPTPGATVTLTTPYGEADGKLTDVDTWGRPRITGIGRPPF